MRVVAFGIHPDDVELGCGATVALLAEKGHEVTIVDLSPGESASNGSVEERSREAREAVSILGVAGRVNLGIRDTKIASEDDEQTMLVVGSIRRQRPDLALIPNKVDAHPDHASGGALIERAIYFAGIHGYGGPDRPWKVKNVLVYLGRRDMDPHIVVDVSGYHERKMQAIRAHRSQFIREQGRKETVLNSPEFFSFLESRSRFYGWKIGAAHGEPFRLLGALRVRDPGVLFEE